MAYIGKSPVIGNFVKLDAITAVNGQAAYTMQNGSVNFTDYSSVNQFLVSLNGTIQAPTTSFTVSGSTLTFASNLSTGDVIDFIMVFGNSLSAGTPTDATVTTAKLAGDAVTEAKIADGAVESEHLNANIISGQTELAEAPADTDELLVSDAGVLKRMDYSHIKASSDFVKLASAEVSSSVAQVDIEGYFSSTYENYKLILNSVHPASTASIAVRYKFGSSYATSSYYYVWDGAQTINNATISTLDNGNFNEDRLYIGGTSHTNQDWSGHCIIDIFQPYKTDRHQYIRSRFIGGNANANTPLAVLDSGGLQYTDLSALSGIRILMGSGNIESMDWTLYGMKN